MSVKKPASPALSTSPNSSQNRSQLRMIRTRTEDSAFVYFVLEAHEGICSYSTLPFRPGDAFRDMIIRIPPGFEEEVRLALAPLGDKIYELDPSTR